MRQQNDPIAQAMQLLQFVTQHRGQQAEINLDQQRLGLMERGMENDMLRAQQEQERFQQGLELDRLRLQQQQEQFQTGLSWDKERDARIQQRHEAEQQRALIEAAQRMGVDTAKWQAENEYRKWLQHNAEQEAQLKRAGLLAEVAPMFAGDPMLQQPGTSQAAHGEQVRQALMQWMVPTFPGLKIPAMPQMSANDQARGY